MDAKSEILKVLTKAVSTADEKAVQSDVCSVSWLVVPTVASSVAPKDVPRGERKAALLAAAMAASSVAQTAGAMGVHLVASTAAKMAYRQVASMAE
jgi:hypothetical protein